MRQCLIKRAEFELRQPSPCSSYFQSIHSMHWLDQQWPIDLLSMRGVSYEAIKVLRQSLPRFAYLIIWKYLECCTRMPNRRAKNRMKEERYIVTSSKDEWCMRIESIIFCVGFVLAIFWKKSSKMGAKTAHRNTDKLTKIKMWCFLPSTLS